MEYAQRVGGQTQPEDFGCAIGLIECTSITTGVVVTDAMLKHAPVEMLWARTVSPGHWIALFCGEVDEVRVALTRAIEVGGEDIVDDLFIANLAPAVPEAIRGPRAGLDIDALGIVEFKHVASTIIAADAAVKTADVELIELRLGMHLGGKGFFLLTGSTGDVEDAVAAAAAIGRERGTLVRDAVIARATEELIPHLLGDLG